MLIPLVISRELSKINDVKSKPINEQLFPTKISQTRESETSEKSVFMLPMKPGRIEMEAVPTLSEAAAEQGDKKDHSNAA